MGFSGGVAPGYYIVPSQVVEKTTRLSAASGPALPRAMIKSLLTQLGTSSADLKYGGALRSFTAALALPCGL